MIAVVTNPPRDVFLLEGDHCTTGDGKDCHDGVVVPTKYREKMRFG